MSKPDYAAFDAELLRLIARGFNNFTALHTPEIRKLAQRFTSYSSDTSRVIDRRLQALRKAGKITYSHHGGWAIKEPA